jgi:hypothetical protein
MPTVKGMNPVTGQKTEGYGLERYENKCPVHNIDFREGRFCEECNYKWPPQNYVAAPNRLWWDGFRTSDGKVRQFFFTEDLAKSIPENVIGKQNTVPAFGFAFYKTKQTRGNPPLSGSRGGWTIGEISGVSITNSKWSSGSSGYTTVSQGMSGTLTGHTLTGSYTSNSLNSQLDAFAKEKFGKICKISEPDIEEASACAYMVEPQEFSLCLSSSETNDTFKISDFEQHQESIQ